MKYIVVSIIIGLLAYVFVTRTTDTVISITTTEAQKICVNGRPIEISGPVGTPKAGKHVCN